MNTRQLRRLAELEELAERTCRAAEGASDTIPVEAFMRLPPDVLREVIDETRRLEADREAVYLDDLLPALTPEARQAVDEWLVELERAGGAG